MTSRERIEMRIEILHFFANNPYVVDTAGGIALRVGWPEEAVRVELERLVALGILQKQGSEEEPLYRYVSPHVGGR